MSVCVCVWRGERGGGGGDKSTASSDGVKSGHKIPEKSQRKLAVRNRLVAVSCAILNEISHLWS